MSQNRSLSTALLAVGFYRVRIVGYTGYKSKRPIRPALVVNTILKQDVKVIAGIRFELTTFG